jgi:hypothetical protein
METHLSRGRIDSDHDSEPRVLREGVRLHRTVRHRRGPPRTDARGAPRALGDWSGAWDSVLLGEQGTRGNAAILDVEASPGPIRVDIVKLPDVRGAVGHDGRYPVPVASQREVRSSGRSIWVVSLDILRTRVETPASEEKERHYQRSAAHSAHGVCRTNRVCWKAGSHGIPRGSIGSWGGHRHGGGRASKPELD